MLLGPTIKRHRNKEGACRARSYKLQAIPTSSLAVFKNGERRTGRFCHVSGVNVYLGRQRGTGLTDLEAFLALSVQEL